MFKRVSIGLIYRWSITLIAVILIVAAFYATIRFSYSTQIKEGESLAWISAFIGIANALFLYATLKSQNNSIALQNRVQFETTFFNLLRFHLQVSDDIHIYRPILNIEDISRIDNIMYKGRDFFPFALGEIYRIFDSITKERISYYNQKDAQDRLVELENNMKNPALANEINRNAEFEKIYQEESEALLNSFYNIKEEDLKTTLDAFGHSFEIFDRKMKGNYEQYERSLVSLLTFIKDSSQDADKYINIVKSQIGLDEYHFIQYLLKTNKKLLFLVVDMELYVGKDERRVGHRMKRYK